ncbi:hypothetical protein [Heliobacterium chlorum]
MSRARFPVTAASTSMCTGGVRPPASACPQLPGTLLRIFIPPGAVINLLNLLEVSSPAGICLIVRIPLLGGSGSTSALSSLIQQVQQCGGTVQFQ